MKRLILKLILLLVTACDTPTHSISNTPSSLHNKVIIPPIFQSPVKKGSPATSKSTLTAQPTVQCPICSIEIPERNINIHLDQCLERQQESSQK